MKGITKKKRASRFTNDPSERAMDIAFHYADPNPEHWFEDIDNIYNQTMEEFAGG